MRRRKLRWCRQCGIGNDRAGVTISRRGLCLGCASANAMDSITQLQEKKGPYYDKWSCRVMQSILERSKKHAEKERSTV